MSDPDQTIAALEDVLTETRMPRTSRVQLAMSAVEQVDVHTRQHIDAQLLNLLLVARQAKGGTPTIEARDIGAIEQARDILITRAE